MERHSASTLKSFKIIFTIQLPWPFITWVACKDALTLQRHFSHQHQHLLGGYKKLAHYSLPVHNGRGTGKAEENALGRGKKEKKNRVVKQPDKGVLARRCWARNQSLIVPYQPSWVRCAVSRGSILHITDQGIEKKKIGNNFFKVMKKYPVLL